MTVSPPGSGFLKTGGCWSREKAGCFLQATSQPFLLALRIYIGFEVALVTTPSAGQPPGGNVSQSAPG
jgi:hypothetical protein